MFGYISIYSRNGPTTTGDYTGSPLNGGQLCNSCHTPVGNYTPAVSIQLLNSSGMPVTEYQQGVSYTVRISMSTSTGTNPNYGFQIVALQSSTNIGINSWGALPTTSKRTAHNGRDYIEHAYVLSNNVIDLPWTAPATNTGDITFYCAANIVNGNYNPSGDNSTSNRLTIHAFGLSSCISPVLATIVNDIRCKGDSTGSTMLTATGGSFPHQFWWTGSSNYTSSNQHLSNVRAGTYIAVVTSTGGCSTSINVVVNEPLVKLSAVAAGDIQLCVGNPIVSAGLASGGTGNLHTQWMTPLGRLHFSHQLHLAPADTAHSGAYVFTATDANGCQASDTMEVMVQGMPVADSISIIHLFPGKDSFICHNPRFVDMYHWETGNGTVYTTPNPVHLYTDTLAYQLRLTITNPCGADTIYKTVRSTMGVGTTRPATVSVFPNPATSILFVTTRYMNGCSAQVFNTWGMAMQQVQLSWTSYMTLSIDALPPGTYFLRITSGSHTELIRFMKQ